jgi:hypothetical protein
VAEVRAAEAVEAEAAADVSQRNGGRTKCLEETEPVPPDRDR